MPDARYAAGVFRTRSLASDGTKKHINSSVYIVTGSVKAWQTQGFPVAEDWFLSPSYQGAPLYDGRCFSGVRRCTEGGLFTEHERSSAGELSRPVLRWCACV